MFDEKTEREKLNLIFQKLPENRKRFAEGLTANASFMICELQKLQEDIIANGIVEKYQNGANQYGNKESVSFSAFCKLQKNYVSTMNALSKLLPKAEEEENELITWLRDHGGLPD
ncbi:MAG: hypothetical protein K5988_03215 [Lachnospiraceae bacterium]|nr:hypothetical protein [Lachnospiraceae bacterium]